MRLSWKRQDESPLNVFSPGAGPGLMRAGCDQKGHLSKVSLERWAIRQRRGNPPAPSHLAELGDRSPMRRVDHLSTAHPRPASSHKPSGGHRAARGLRRQLRRHQTQHSQGLVAQWHLTLSDGQRTARKIGPRIRPPRPARRRLDAMNGCGRRKIRQSTLNKIGPCLFSYHDIIYRLANSGAACRLGRPKRDLRQRRRVWKPPGNDYVSAGTRCRRVFA